MDDRQIDNLKRKYHQFANTQHYSNFIKDQELHKKKIRLELIVKIINLLDKYVFSLKKLTEVSCPIRRQISAILENNYQIFYKKDLIVLRLWSVDHLLILFQKCHRIIETQSNIPKIIPHEILIRTC